MNVAEKQRVTWRGRQWCKSKNRTVSLTGEKTLGYHSQETRQQKWQSMCNKDIALIDVIEDYSETEGNSYT
jgi:hypothetical protein